MTLNLQKEQLSISYLHTILSVVGYKLQEIKIDDESVDCEIRTQIKGTGSTPRHHPRLGVQLKATSSPQIINNDTILSFSLSKKNYEDLIESNNMVPKILIVLILPNGNFIQEKHNSLEIFHKMYYVSLVGGKPLAGGATSKNVHIPLANIVTTDKIVNLLTILSQGGVI